ncbi:histidinol-phosphate aminotransferase [Kordiimonas sediminis]|uniref:Histidinol-phosphate aminotransferase n=1 Tax=Kordiimonas sediminis TaxID=1735581 RepID=A0A919E5X1_9PROT|nr:histidinol-phosphate transaminase [Kordiimonas sediminis]GHF16106.1 histidinol-phosphate aminotransferase [Kordiimonas sediminis]
MVNRRQFISALGSVSLIGTAAATGSGLSAEDVPKEVPSGPIYLNQNENPLGMSPHAKKAANAALAYGHRYPDAMVRSLAAKIAHTEGLSNDSVIIGAGSTGLLIAQMFAMSGPNTTVIAPAPTFSRVERQCAVTGATYVPLPVNDRFEVDLEGLERLSAKTTGPVIVYIVTPNNPTGVLVPTNPLFNWIKRAPANVFFLIDEAYHDFVDDPAYQSAVSLVKEGYKNVFVARTFSKLHGMAGMRVGYGFGHADVTGKISAYYAPWNLALPSIAAAMASLDDTDFIARGKKSNSNGKAILTETLDALGLAHIPSQTNFVLHQITGDHQTYKDRMEEAGFLVGRYMNTGPGWNRVSIGTPEEMQAFCRTLKNFRDKDWI